MSRRTPNKLFKYRSLATEEDRRYTSEIFLRNRIWFSTPASFNDPFDHQFVLKSDASREEKMEFFRESLRWRYGLPDSEVEHRTKKMFSPTRRRERAAWEREQLDRIQDTRNRIGVFCLTEVNDDILMWSHYADKHQGICLGFTLGCQEHIDFFAQANDVKYQDSFPEVSPFVQDAPGEKLGIMALTKSSHWSYEKEWRIIRVEGPGKEALPAGLLTSVVLGARISPCNRQLVLAWAAAHPTPFKVWEAKLKESEYGLEIREASRAHTP